MGRGGGWVCGADAESTPGGRPRCRCADQVGVRPVGRRRGRHRRVVVLPLARCRSSACSSSRPPSPPPSCLPDAPAAGGVTASQYRVSRLLTQPPCRLDRSTWGPEPLGSAACIAAFWPGHSQASGCRAPREAAGHRHPAPPTAAKIAASSRHRWPKACGEAAGDRWWQACWFSASSA